MQRRICKSMDWGYSPYLGRSSMQIPLAESTCITITTPCMLTRESSPITSFTGKDAISRVHEPSPSYLILAGAPAHRWQSKVPLRLVGGGSMHRICMHAGQEGGAWTLEPRKEQAKSARGIELDLRGRQAIGTPYKFSDVHPARRPFHLLI